MSWSDEKIFRVPMSVSRLAEEGSGRFVPCCSAGAGLRKTSEHLLGCRHTLWLQPLEKEGNVPSKHGLFIRLLTALLSYIYGYIELLFKQGSGHAAEGCCSPSTPQRHGPRVVQGHRGPTTPSCSRADKDKPAVTCCHLLSAPPPCTWPGSGAKGSLLSAAGWLHRWAQRAGGVLGDPSCLPARRGADACVHTCVCVLMRLHSGPQPSCHTHTVHTNTYIDAYLFMHTHPPPPHTHAATYGIYSCKYVPRAQPRQRTRTQPTQTAPQHLSPHPHTHSRAVPNARPAAPQRRPAPLAPPPRARRPGLWGEGPPAGGPQEPTQAKQPRRHLASGCGGGQCGAAQHSRAAGLEGSAVCVGCPPCACTGTARRRCGRPRRVVKMKCFCSPEPGTQSPPVWLSTFELRVPPNPSCLQQDYDKTVCIFP